MKINKLINEIKSKRGEIYNKYYDEETGGFKITKAEYKELDRFIVNVLNEYQTVYCSEEEDSTFAYHLVLLEMDRAKIYQMINK